jgi:hypothetical protein
MSKSRKLTTKEEQPKSFHRNGLELLVGVFYSSGLVELNRFHQKYVTTDLVTN